MNHIHFILSQSLIHTSVNDSVAMTSLLFLWVEKLIHQIDLLDEIAPDISDNVVKVVGRVRVVVGEPKA